MAVHGVYSLHFELQVAPHVRTQFRNIENCMVAVSLIIGGDWIRQGEFAVGSKPWSPRHVKQG